MSTKQLPVITYVIAATLSFLTSGMYGVRGAKTKYRRLFLLALANYVKLIKSTFTVTALISSKDPVL